MTEKLSEINLPAGRYILAVSGGVDSIVLLDLLAKSPQVKLIVAHFDHGIRADSAKDAELVQKIAKKHGFKIETGNGNLGPNASEEAARDARYEFLNTVKVKHNAKAVITAHHQDDLIETAFLNILRGSGRRGLTSISQSDIIRPLLVVSKAEIVKYAQEHRLEWREDSTNLDSKYLRNHLRQNSLASMNAKNRDKIVNNLEKVAKINLELNKEIATLSQQIKNKTIINRSKFILLPESIAEELMMFWLRESEVRQFDRKSIKRLTNSVKTAKSGTKEVVKKDFWLQIEQKTAHFSNR